MEELTYEEQIIINGGQIKFSDVCFLGAGICFAFVSPPVGVAVCIGTFIISESAEF